ncbi:MAG: ATP-binding protein [Candidatus Micrarchaeota archaeon]
MVRVPGDKPPQESARPVPRRSDIRSFGPKSATFDDESREMREICDALFERSTDAVFICQLDGTFIRANPAALSLLGVSVDALQESRFLDFIPNEELSGAVESMREIIETGSQAEMRRFHIRSRSGSEVAVNTRASLLTNEGEPYAILAIARDVSESMGEVSGRAAHDIRNLLTPITMLVNHLSHMDFSSPEALASLRFLLPASSEALQRVDRLLLELSHLTSPGMREVSRVPMEDLLTSLIVRARASIKDEGTRRYSFAVDFCPGSPVILGDRAKLDRAIWNIIRNAIDAMPEGGEISVCTGIHDGKSLLIVISDTGPGMDEETRPMVFKPYFTTKGERGTGLGLAITQKVINDHGGSVSVESEPGKGTTFLIALPLPSES